MIPYQGALDAFLLIYSYTPLGFRAFVVTSLFFGMIWSVIKHILEL